MSKSWGEFYKNQVSFNFLVQNASCHLPMFDSILKEKPKKILEVGTGSGAMSVFLSYLGFKVTSLDNDKKVLSNAKDLAKDFNGKVNFVYGDGFKMDFQDNSFDLAFHQGLLEHFSDEEIYSLLDEQLRVSKAVVLSVPNHRYPTKDFGNERLLSKEQWDKMLSSKYNLVESVEYNPHTKIILGGRFIRKIYNTMYLAKITRPSARRKTK